MKEVTCAMAFYRRGDEVLVAMKKRGHAPGKYHAIGGKLEPNESYEQALARESREEIGVRPMNYWAVAELDYMKPDGDEPWHIYHRVYLCDEWEGEPADIEAMTPEWFKLEQVPYDMMWPDNEYWLPQVLAGNKVYGEFTYDKDENLIAHNVEIVEQLPSEVIS